jgi:hypothetical protein
MRYVSKFPFTLTFNKQNSLRSTNTYRSLLEIGVRNFIKGYVAKQPMFGLAGTEFKTSSELISFLTEFISSLDNKLCAAK